MLETTLFYVAQYIFRLIFITMDVDNGQDAHVWLTSYMSHLHEEGRVTTWGTLTVLNDIQKVGGSRRRDDNQPLTAKSKSNIFFVPGAGVHFVRVSWWRWVVVHKTVAETAGRNGEGAVKEVLWLGTLGVGDSFFRWFIEKARAHSFLHDTEATVIYVQESYRGTWKKALTKTKRHWESVILDGNLADAVYEECVTFLKSRDWYTSLGVPYRRSFLLESAPGCGKSSFIQALAGRLNFDICFLSLSASDLSDQELAEQLRSTPPESLVVLEELDAAFPDRTKASKEALKKAKHKSLTLSGLLSALDGLVAGEGKIFMFTTNHLEQLDPALLRPGRVDRVVSLKLATAKQIEQLFVRFHTTKFESVARLYARSIPQYELSMAQVQNHLLRFRDRPVDAVSDIPNYLAEIRAAARRRKLYEDKLNQSQKSKDKKKKNGSDVEDDNEDNNEEERGETRGESGGKEGSSGEQGRRG